MKDLISPFLDRFKHPIFSSIIGTFLVWNLEIILPVAFAFFRGNRSDYEMTSRILFNALSNPFLNSRFWFPVLIGLCYAFLILPGFDSLHGKAIAIWMRLKNNWVEKENEKNFVNQAKVRELEMREILLTLEGNNKEESALVNLKFALYHGATIRCFRVNDSNLKDQVVFFEKNDNLLRRVSSYANRPIGVCIGYLSKRYAIVATQGKILHDGNYNPNSKLYLSANGSLTEQVLHGNSFGVIGDEDSVNLRFLSLDIENRQPDPEGESDRLKFFIS